MNLTRWCIFFALGAAALEPRLLAQYPLAQSPGEVGVFYSALYSGPTEPCYMVPTVIPPGTTYAGGVVSGVPTQSGVFVGRIIEVCNPGSIVRIWGPIEFIIYPAVSIARTSLPQPQVSSAYSATVVATDGLQPYTFSITSGSLPPGLSLNPQSGVIGGIPTVGGVFPFGITVTDSLGGRASSSFSLSIPSPPAGVPAMTGLMLLCLAVTLVTMGVGLTNHAQRSHLMVVGERRTKTACISM